ncbi:MAG: D-alanyl-D-alanine carboxypeptidase [Alphaproteobacteria bacterium]|nr:D-alanyl-D-alanine carboxypeptidase [Alphaproteobacteria bacterium]
MLFKNKLYLSTLVVSAIFVATIHTAAAIETPAKNVIIMDFETGQYIYTKDHQKMIPPASMSKLMTVYMIFEKLKDGSLSLDDTFTVSENAWRKGGAASGSSTMFLKIGEKVTVRDIIQGIIIQSGNDACIVAAENLSGSEEDFATEMQKKARQMGLKHSSFANATGWPHPDQLMSVEDLAKLARAIIYKFPEYYHIFSEHTFTHNNIKQGNRNPLLYSMQHADGLKTGHTEEAGFCLVASAKKDNRRLISVMAGLKSNKERSEEAEKLMTWGFREFSNYNMLKKVKVIETIPVCQGSEENINLIIEKNIRRTLKKSSISKIKMTAVYDKPVTAPIKKGDQLGIVKIDIPGQQDLEIPLIADRDVKKLGFFGRIKSNLQYLLLGNQ